MSLILEKSSKTIKDPVHGYIKVNNEETKIIDSIYFQRLRNIVQLSTTQMVYPGARHTRFEHSLGVFHLSKQIFNELRNNSNGLHEDMDDDDLDLLEKTLRFAALLHDIGHYPFSHLGEIFESKEILIDKLENNYKFITKIKNNDKSFEGKKKSEMLIRTDLKNHPQHELASCIIVLERYSKMLSEFGVDPYEVCSFILGFSFKKDIHWQYDVTSQILNSNIDADKLDYILRDKKMSGASIVSIDGPTMIMAYAISDKRLALSMKSFSIINNFLESREAIYMWVCQHHKVVFSNALMRKMIEQLKNEDIKQLFSHENIINSYVDDFDVISKIRNEMKTNSILSYYYESYRRRSFLKSCWKHIADFREIINKESARADLTHDVKPLREDIEGYISNKVGINITDVIVDIADIKAFKPSETNDIWVKNRDGKTKRLSDLNLHVQRKFVKPLPYIYVPDDKLNATIILLRDYSSDLIVGYVKEQKTKKHSKQIET